MSKFIVGKESDGLPFIVDIAQFEIRRIVISKGGNTKKGFFYWVRLEHLITRQDEKDIGYHYLYYAETIEEAKVYLQSLIKVLNKNEGQ